MSSIFIWKTKRNTSVTHVPYYFGSNWFQIENKPCYKMINQMIMEETDVGNVLVYKVKCMPRDWMGTLLSIDEISYELIKKDDYATLEQIDTWMYLTLHSPITFDILCIMNEWKKILEWYSVK